MESEQGMDRVASMSVAIEPGKPVAVLISGMHRCGTSALARTLSLLGATLPTDLIPPNPGNPCGHWEPREMVELNDRMLHDARSDLYGVRSIDPNWFDGPVAARFVDEAGIVIDRGLDGAPLAVLKDPRTALLAPIWNRALEEKGYRVAHVLPLRHPVDVAASLRRRHLRDFPYDAWTCPRGEAVWLRYTLAAVRGSREHDRAFLRYADLLGDWRREVARIGREIGVVWPGLGTAQEAEVDAFLHGNERADSEHPTCVGSRDLQALNLPELAAACYDELAAKGDDATVLDAFGAEYAERIARAGDLIGSLEQLYPLVWQYFEMAAAGQRRLDLSLVAEARLRDKAQRDWSALTEANDDRLRMQLDAGSRDRQIVSLSGEVARLERLVEEADGRAIHESEATPLRGEIDDIDALRRGKAALESRLAAMEASTSWRLTTPLRTLRRMLRGRA